MEVGKLCRKMHRGIFECNDDDPQEVMNDLYGNISRILYKIISRLENRESIDGDDVFLDLTTKGILIFGTFFRCSLKWCIGVENGSVVVNRRLIGLLTDLELLFFNLAEYLFNNSTTVQEPDEELRVAKDEINRIFGASTDLIAKTYVHILSPRYTPSNFMVSEVLVLDFLDIVLMELSWSPFQEPRQTLSHNLRSLRNYLQFSKGLVNREKFQELLIRVEAVVDKTACCVFFLWCDFELYYAYSSTIELEMSMAILNVFVLQIDSNPQLTNEILIVFMDSVQICLGELLKYDAINLLGLGLVKDQLQLLREALGFLGHLFLNILPTYSEQDKELDIILQFQVVARDIAYVITSLNNVMEENAATDTGTLVLSDFLQKIELLTEHVTVNIVSSFLDRLRQKFPQTDQMFFLNILIENVKELMDCKSDLLLDSVEQVKRIYEDLVFFRSFLQNLRGTITTGDESKDISISIMNIAYEAEYLTNIFVLGACYLETKSLWISDLMQKIKLVRATTVNIIERKANADEIEIASKDPSASNSQTIDATRDPYHAPSRESVPTTDVVVGFEVEMELIMGRLASDFKQIDVVSIIGMPGLGKTTLAKKVYEDPFIVDHFQIRAWCCVSQEYHKKEVLLTILGSIIELTDLLTKKSDEDLSVMLHKQLTGRRYLIVMDDVWGMDAYEDIKRFFPDNSNGSRVMLTTRNKLIGLEENYHSNPLELRLLTDDESWELLRQKVYHKKECPLQLCDVGKEIAQKCQGLPLALVVVAGLLAKSDKNPDFWKQVAENLSLYIAGDTQKQVMATLELSYNLLPHHLKPLFLYLGAFPEDNEIPAKKLIWLWISEGFVRRTELRSLEVEAEMNLLDLIDRSLLMVAERRSDGRVKACRIHDLLRDMCLKKAEEENFLKQMYVYGELPAINYQHRLSICPRGKYGDSQCKASSKPFHTDVNFPMLPIALPLRSALLFVMNKDILYWEKDIESALFNSKLLRVLHCHSADLGNYLLENVRMLPHLRYIYILASCKSIPLSLSFLQNLESLTIKGLGGEIEVPDWIWKMMNLRHLHIDHWATFSDAVEKHSKLENLQTLSTPAFYSGEKNQLIRRIPNLQKLRCIFMNRTYGNSYDFPELESFNQLESLKVLYHGSGRPSGLHSVQFNLPYTLKKLSLLKFRLKWHEVSGLEKLLPNLEILKLRLWAVDGELWDVEDVEFPKLKYLKLENLNIQRWNASPENFPCLKKLVLQRCKQLEEIPSSVGDFYSLEKMEVLWCSPSAAKSAKQIQEEQKDMGNELLNVHIYPPVLDL